MTRKRPHKRRRRGSGLQDHARHGKTLVSPLNQLPTPPAPVDWLRDVFPEMLWLCSMVVDHPWGEARDIVVETMRRLETYRPEGGAVLTGTLSSFEIVPADSRMDAVAALRTDDLYERAFSPALAQSLGMYPSAPGRWVVEPQFNDGLRIDPEIAESHLAGLTTTCFDGRSDASTWAKAAWIARFMVEGKVSIPHDMPGIDLFTTPFSELTEDELDMVRTMIRSMFLAMWGAESERQASALQKWPREFWQANYRLYACSPPEQASSSAMSRGEDEGLCDTWSKLATTLAHSFGAALLTADPDLYEPDRYEVLVGLAARTIRIALSLTSCPDLWRPEACHPLVRAAVESRITLEWLEGRGDRGLFSKYKDYGRGHLKLYKLQLEEHMGSDESGTIDALLDFWQAHVDKDLGEELQDVDLGAFVTDLRTKAIEVDLKRDYDLVYRPACAEVHGEWASLDRLYLVQCLNPLHRGHRLPSLEPTSFIALGGVQIVLRYAFETAKRCCDFLGISFEPSAPGAETDEVSE